MSEYKLEPGPLSGERLALAWRKFLAFPTWCIIRPMRRHLPDSHPWKGKPMDFDWWQRGATRLTLNYGYFYWLCLWGLLVFGGKLIWLKFHQ